MTTNINLVAANALDKAIGINRGLGVVFDLLMSMNPNEQASINTKDMAELLGTIHRDLEASLEEVRSHLSFDPPSN